MKRLVSAAIVLVAIAPAIACGTKDASPPSAGTYTISFPSTAAAVAADSVSVYVFDASDGGAELCPSLIIARRNKLGLPVALLETRPVSPCDLAAGIGQVKVSYGVRAVLAVAQKGQNDLLMGCAVENVGEGSTQVPVQLALVGSTVSVPATKCVSLGDHCANRCPP